MEKKNFDEKKKKKILLPIIIAAAVLLLGGTAGVLAALGVFKGGKPAESTEVESTEAEDDGDPILWWNVDRSAYAGQSEIGTSSRKPDKDDGYYHVLFASEGRQVTRRIAEKKVLNVVDGNDLMVLEFDEKGIVTGVKRVEEATGGYAIQGLYVSEVFDDGTLLLNTAQNLEGLDEEYEIPDDVPIFDVSGVMNYVGMQIKKTDLQKFDRIYAIMNKAGEIYRVFVTYRFVQPQVYWNVSRQWNSELLATKREPNADGEYEFLMAYNGEQITVKCKTRELASAIDKVAAKCVGLAFDSAGYVSKVSAATQATGGSSFGSWYHIMAMDGRNISAEKVIQASDTGKKVDGILAEDYRAFDVSGKGDFIGQEVFDLRVSDQIHGLKNAQGEVCIVFIVGRQVQSELYWNVDRQYDSKAAASKRVKAADGYYHFKLAYNGQQGDFITDDKAIADQLDATAVRCFGLELDGNKILKMYASTLVKTGGSAASWYDVLSISGNKFHAEKLIQAKDTGKTYDGEFAPDVEVYNVSSNYNSFAGEKTTLKVGDRVHCLKDYTGKVQVVYVVNRPISSEIYWNLERKYDSKTATTTRKPDEQGYYVFTLAVNGGQKVVRTKSKTIATQIDAVAARCFGLKLAGDVVQKVYAAKEVTQASGGSAASWYTVKSISGSKFHALKELKASDTGKTYDGVIKSTTKVYNVGGFYTVAGEKTQIQVGDIIHCLKDKDGNLSYVFVVTRAAQDRKATCPICGQLVEQKAAGAQFAAQTDAAGNPLAISHYYVPTDMSMTAQGTTPNAGSANSYAPTSIVHLDVNGHKLTAGSGQRLLALFGSGAELYVSDSTGKGVLVSGAGRPDDKGAFIWFQSGNSKLTIENVTLDLSGLNAMSSQSAIYNTSTSNQIILKNVKVIGGEAGKSSFIRSNGTVKLTDVTVEGGKTDEKGSIRVYGDGVLELNGKISVSGATGADGVASNIVLEDNAKLTTTDGIAATEDGAIHITLNNEGAFTTTGFAGMAGKFTLDSEGVEVKEEADGSLSVKVTISGIEASVSKTELELGDADTITVDVLPIKPSGVTFTYESSDPTKVTVDDTGKVYAVGETGETPVIVTVKTTIDGSDFTDTIEITVLPSSKPLDHFHAETTKEKMETETLKIAYTAWTESTKFPTESGYYYLDTDITLSSQIQLKENQELHLCLNGHKIAYGDSTGKTRTLALFNEGCSFHLCDCQDTGEIIAPEGGEEKTGQGRAVWVRYGTFNMYGGTLTGSRTMHTDGGGTVTIQSVATFNLYGGTVRGGSAQSYLDGTTKKYSCGGNIAVLGTFNMYGGTVEGGQVISVDNLWTSGGNIYQKSSTSTVNILGGTIKDGKATGSNAQGANIGMVGVVTLKDAIVSGGVAGSVGGNIWCDSNSALTIDGAQILDGVAASGGNIYTKSSKANALTLVNTPVISGGKDLDDKDSDIFLAGSAKITIGEGFASVEGAPYKVAMNTTGTFTTNEAKVEDFETSMPNYKVEKNQDGTLAIVLDIEEHQHVLGTYAQIQPSLGTGEIWQDLNAKIAELRAANPTTYSTNAKAMAGLPDGYYFLSADLNMGGQMAPVANSDIKICLNGYTLTGSRGITTFNLGATLSICDCSAAHTGTVTGTHTSQAGNWARYGTMNIYGGNFLNCSAGSFGGGIAVDGSTSEVATLNIYDGVFDGNTAVTNGGNIQARGNVNLLGGVLKNGSAEKGGNLFLTSTAYVVLNGVEISGGKTTSTELPAHDIYMAADAKLDIISVVGSNIAIYMETPGVISANVVDAATAAKFVAANEGYMIKVNAEGKLEMTAHEHCVCGGTLTDGQVLSAGAPTPVKHTCEDVVWQAWTSADSLPTFADLEDGMNYFYLTEDVTMTSSYFPHANGTTKESDMAGKKIAICLNGHTITTKATRFLSTYDSATKTHVKNLELTFTDCTATPGTIVMKGTLGSNQGALGWFIGTDGVLNIYNVTFDASKCSGTKTGATVQVQNGTFNMYSGKILCATVTTNGAGINVGVNGTFNMFGGEITGGTVNYGTSTWGIGGNVYLDNDTSVMNMYGGTISNGVATHGGNIGIEKGTLNVYGGTISGGQSTQTGTVKNGYMNTVGGGNIYVNKGVMNMYGGTVTKGTAIYTGGNIAVGYNSGPTYGTLNLSGGTVSDGSVNSSKRGSSYGGNIYSRGIFNMIGGVVTGGNAKENVAASKNTTNSGVAAQGSGGNIAIGGGTFTMTGGEITNGTAALGAGALYLRGHVTDNPVVATVSGGKISGNQSWGGGAIRLDNLLTDMNGTVLTLKGDVEISDNFANSTTGYGSGIYLAKGKLIISENVKFANNVNSSATQVACDIMRRYSMRADNSLEFKSFTGTDPIKVIFGDDETLAKTYAGSFATTDADVTSVVSYGIAGASVVYDGGELKVVKD